MVESFCIGRAACFKKLISTHCSPFYFGLENVIVSKMASHAISPIAITFYRLVFALAVMSTFCIDSQLEKSPYYSPVLETFGFRWIFFLYPYSNFCLIKQRQPRQQPIWRL